jgi:predicted TIM-barrel fold metal-dependent hydrolase
VRRPAKRNAKDALNMTIAAKSLSRRTLLGAAFALPAWPRLSAAAPLELYDSHIHFFTNDIARYPIDPRNSREGEQAMRARIMSDPGTPEKIFAWWADTDVTAGAGVQYSGAYKTDNSYVLDLADRFPNRIQAEIIIDARDPQSPARIEELVATRRVSAMRLTGYVDGTEAIPWLNSAPALDVWAVADSLELPVGITFLPPRGTESALSAVRTLAERFTRCPILLEHFGRLVQGDLSQAHLALRHHSNIHFKWTTNVIDELKAQGRSTSVFLRSAADRFGIDRLMWGSDCGNTLRPYADMVDDAIASTDALTAAERRSVLHDNGSMMFRHRERRAAPEEMGTGATTATMAFDAERPAWGIE